MITVKNRELIIPRDEFNIGTNYDDESEVRIFSIPRVMQGGVDIANLTFRLDLKFANGDSNTAAMEKEITDDAILLTMTVVNSMLQVPGTILIQLRAFDEDGKVKWSSYQGALFFEDHINTPASYTGSLTELEQIEVQLDKVLSNEDERVSAEAKRQANETQRISNETARVQAETERNMNYAAAEAAREQKIDDEINTFRDNWSELREWRDESLQSVEDCETARDICEKYADVILPVMSINFDTGELEYNDKASYIFTVNEETGNLEFEGA